uniref:RpoC2_2 protein n=1 Tax=Fopius arisanus TaxID=64838 RepID=A0A0C9QF51_9HYME
MGDTKTEHIVMTPKCKTANSTTLIIERQSLDCLPQTDQRGVHVAGGDHQGIVINKHATAANGISRPAHLGLEFRVFLVSAQTKKHTQESRRLQFWFVNSLPEIEQPHVAQEFFRELVSPQEFPRDYVGFIKKIMKLMQHKYPNIKKLEVELKQLEEPITLPWRPLSIDETIIGQAVELTAEKVLELIESAYPNPVNIEDMAKEYNWEADAVTAIMVALEMKGMVKAMGLGAFTRVAHQDTQIKVVKQMPTMASAKQPTIAIITAQYCEKLAVDSMIENKETFVRYTTVGETPFIYLTLAGMIAH